MEKDTETIIEQIIKRLDGNDKRHEGNEEDIKSLRDSRHDLGGRVGNLEGRIVQVIDRVAVVADNNDKLERVVEKLETVVELNTKAVRDLITSIHVGSKMLKILFAFISFLIMAVIAAHGVGWL